MTRPMTFPYSSFWKPHFFCQQKKTRLNQKNTKKKKQKKTNLKWKQHKQYDIANPKRKPRLTFFTRSKFPSQASLIWATKFKPQSFAAFTASSTSKLLPTWPVWRRSPSWWKHVETEPVGTCVVCKYIYYKAAAGVFSKKPTNLNMAMKDMIGLTVCWRSLNRRFRGFQSVTGLPWMSRKDLICYLLI